MKTNAIAILVIGMLLLSSFTIAPAISYAVEPDVPDVKTTLYVGGSGGGNYTKIQDAINASHNGDTIFVYNGTYNENIIVNKSVTLIGENKDTTTIEGNGNGDTVNISADHVNISGFTIEASSHLKYFGSPYYFFTIPDEYGDDFFNMRFTPEGECKLTTCLFTFYYEEGKTWVNTSEGVDIIVWNDSSGFPDVVLAQINVPASDIKFYPDQTEVDFTSFNLTLDSDFHIGFTVVNQMEDVYAIISDDGMSGTDRSSEYNYNNGQWGSMENDWGIDVNFFITANVCYDSRCIHLFDSSNGNISNNNIRGSNIGFFIEQGSDNYIIYHNNFISNTQNAYDNGNNIWNDSYPSGGNYWDDYTGVDNYQGPTQNILGPDGIGDTPYYIPGGSNQDHYPLMEPYGQGGGGTFIISITDESPTNKSLNVSIYKQNVSVNISIIQLTAYSVDFAFAWEIGGKNITTTMNLSDHIEGRKEAPIYGPLEYNTTYDWYVNVSFGGQYKNVTFNFTTEKRPNQPPVANFTWTINDLTVTFASTSTDPDNDIINWTWNFGDGNSSYGEIIPHIYAQNGTYYVNLTVRDSGGKTNSAIKAINVTNNPPVARFTYAIVGGTETVHFDASDSSDENGTIVGYFWEFGDGKSSTDKIVSHDYERDYTTYRVNLTVTDSAGLTNTTSKYVTLKDTTDPTIKIDKPLKALYINDKFVRRLFIRPALIIGDITISVNASDSGSGIKYVQLWIGKELKENKTTGLFNYTWKKDRLRFIHLFTIKVVAYDKEDNIATKSMIVRKFL